MFVHLLLAIGLIIAAALGIALVVAGGLILMTRLEALSRRRSGAHTSDRSERRASAAPRRERSRGRLHEMRSQPDPL